jgi:transposase-like protein
MMTANHITALLTLAREWAEKGKDDLAHHALDVLDREAEEAEGPPCPGCGERERVEDTGTSAAPRLTCKRCGRSWHPRGDKADG